MTLDFESALLSSSLAILASEIGDKTFFIAAILAMKHPRIQVFFGTFGALVFMNTLSAAVGSVAPALIPIQWTYYASIALFIATGIASLREAVNFSSDPKDEIQRVEKECYSSTETTKAKKTDNGVLSSLTKSGILLKAFTLTFIAEWGDRSQLVTVGLGAVQNVYGVMLGGILGHALCTGAAVLGGKQLASHVEEHIISAVGGFLFLLFALIAVVQGVPTAPTN